MVHRWSADISEPNRAKREPKSVTAIHTRFGSEISGKKKCTAQTPSRMCGIRRGTRRAGGALAAKSGPTWISSHRQTVRKAPSELERRVLFADDRDAVFTTHRAHFGFRRIGKREARGRRVGRSHSPRAATARRAGPVKGRGTRIAMLPRAGWDRERWAGPGALGPVAEDEAPASRPGRKNIAEAASPDCLTCEEESLCTPSGEALSAAGAATRTSPLGVDPRRSVGSIGTHRAGRRPGAIARPGKTGSSGRDARPCPAVVRAPRKSFRFRAHSVDSGLVLLGARGRGGRCKGYEQLMPLVLQTLVRLRCVLASPRAPSAPARPIEEPRFFPQRRARFFPFSLSPRFRQRFPETRSSPLATRAKSCRLRKGNNIAPPRAARR